MSSKGEDDSKKQVYLGDLPDNFMRLGVSGSSAADLDEQTARAIHESINDVPPHQLIAASAFVPPNTRGRLSITVVEANLTKNYGLMRMDPYCRIRVGNTVFETPTDVSGGKNPKWNRTIHSYLPVGVESIYVEIFDERAFTTDERVGWSVVKIPESVFNLQPVDDWYPLSGREGDGKEGMIEIAMAFAPVEAPTTAYVPIYQPQFIPVGGGQPAAIIQTAVAPGPGQQGAPQQQQQPQAQDQTVAPIGGGGDNADAGTEQQPYTVSDEDLKELQDMFPQLQKDVIEDILKDRRGNKEATINELLALSAD